VLTSVESYTATDSGGSFHGHIAAISESNHSKPSDAEVKNVLLYMASHHGV
jgi:hypothetical protein